MNRLGSKRPRVQLETGRYEKLRQQVLERDGWRCQRCGCRGELQVHHINPRSRLGDDTEPNLITLCSQCHQEMHLYRKSAGRTLPG